MIDPKDVSVNIGGYELPGINDINPTFGKSVEAVTSNQGFVGHQIKYKESVCTIKFKPEPRDATLRGLAALFEANAEFAATIITPYEVSTFVRARLHNAPKAPTNPTEIGEYEITFSGYSTGPRPV